MFGQSSRFHLQSSLWTIALAVAVCSMALQGIALYVGNQTLYFPYALRYEQLPQFLDDPFVQTLEGFVSIYWWIVRQFASEDTLPQWIIVSQLVARWLASFALLALALRTIPGRPATLTAALAILSTPLLTGVSLVGDHSLFIDTFSHTDVSNACALLAFLCLARDAKLVAFVLGGLAFDLNQFVGVWVVAALLFASLSFERHSIDRGRRLGALLIQSAVFVLVASPALIWTLSITAQQSAVDFSYVAYLREYYPRHFIIDAASAWQVLELGLMSAAACLSLWATKQFALLRAFVALQAIFLIGVIAPYVFDTPLILNLHLLRVDGLMQMLAVAALLNLLLHRLSGKTRFADLSGPEIVAMFSLFVGEWLLTSLVFLMLAAEGRAWRGRMWLAVFVAVFVAATAEAESPQLEHIVKLTVGTAGVLGLCVLLDRAWPQIASASLRPSVVRLGEWTFVGLTVGVATAGRLMDSSVLLTLLMVGSVFAVRFVPQIAGSAPAAFVMAFGVLPIAAQAALSRGTLASQRTDTSWAEVVYWVRMEQPPGTFLIPHPPSGEGWATPDLSLTAKVPVWIDWKRGAAVMWAPEYYDTWSQRMHDWTKLETADDYLDYACEHGIANVVLKNDGAGSRAPVEALYRNDKFAVVSPTCVAPARY